MQSKKIENFLLNSKTSKKLYSIVRDLPIIDYHNHLSIKDIEENISFDTITKLWISSDPYKHRAMRILGIEEKYITGNGSDYEKFEKWISSLPKLIGNPLYDWSILEMYKIFNIDLIDYKGTTQGLYDELNEKLKGLTINDILAKFNIEYSAPCQKLTDSLSPYENNKTFAPSLRGDDLLIPSKQLLADLGKLTNTEITSIESYLNAINIRLKDFYVVGTRYSDHALDNGFLYIEDDGKNEERFSKLLKEEKLSLEDNNHLSSYLLYKICELYSKQKYVVQLHIGAQRKTSSRLKTLAGAAGGYAGIGNSVDVSSLVRLFDDIEKTEFGLPKIVMYTLNPSDNAMLSILSGSFSKDNIEAIITQGPAWWWCDHKQGIEEMLKNFEVYSVLSTFNGMTTDSRTILSFIRHDYFRRVLSNYLANKIDKKEIIFNEKDIVDLIINMCYKNAKESIK